MASLLPDRHRPARPASLARRERAALCDLAVEVGPDAPTLCDGWTVRDLVCHLLVRERRPWAAPGFIVPALSGVAAREMARLAQQPFPALVDRLRDPGGTPFALGPVDRAANTTELFVHHEDIRRAQHAWEPRALDQQDAGELWGQLRRGGRLMVRRAGVPVTIVDDYGRRAVLRSGDRPVVLTGPVSELLLFLFGRRQLADLAFDGPEVRVAALRQARLGS